MCMSFALVQLVSIKRHSRTLHFSAKLCYLQECIIECKIAKLDF